MGERFGLSGNCKSRKTPVDNRAGGGKKNGADTAGVWGRPFLSNKKSSKKSFGLASAATAGNHVTHLCLLKNTTPSAGHLNLNTNVKQNPARGAPNASMKTFLGSEHKGHSTQKEEQSHNEHS